jgi:hypothetical protein
MPENNEMQLTSHGSTGGSQLISVFYGHRRAQPGLFRTASVEAPY